VLVAPLGVLLVVHMPTDRPRDQNDACADDQRSSYQLFHFHPPSRLPCEGIAAAPIAEDQVRKCELAHTSVRLSKKQRLTELCCKRDATGGCGGGFVLEGWLPWN